MGVSPGVKDVEIKLLLSIFAVQEGPAGPQRGCFLITEEERRWEIAQRTSSTVRWVPIRKDPSPEADFSYLVWPNRRGENKCPAAFAWRDESVLFGDRH